MFCHETVYQTNTKLPLKIKFKKKEIIEVTVESLAFGGTGVAHWDEFAVFIKGALPQQKVAAQILRCKKNYAEAKLLKIINHSPHEMSPRCEYFGICGGCLLQHLNYSEQLRQKQNQVEETLIHIGG